jgi:hypothetical protein
MPEIEVLSGLSPSRTKGDRSQPFRAAAARRRPVFQISSVSKNFASTLAMMLVEDGLVGWFHGGVGVVSLSNDDSAQWDDVLLQLL